MFEIKHWAEVEESILKQKSRIKWLKVGDSNTQYFHHILKEKVARGRIYVLQNDQGEMVEDSTKIQKMIRKYNVSLLVTIARSLEGIDITVIRRGSTLN